ncbi:hypothetical protein E8E11_011400 [Didymella keratinophila]|nr:hypothetical protein E8E11_011400 [Didymella keratinophila]
MSVLYQPMTSMKQVRVGELVDWLEEQVNELKGIGVEDEDYDDVDPEEVVKGFHVVEVGDVEDVNDGVEARDSKGECGGY